MTSARFLLTGTSMTMKFIRISELPSQLNVSKSTIYRWIELGLFMPPMALGPNRKVYFSQEINMYQKGALEGKCRQDLVAQVLDFRAKAISLI